MSQTTPVSKPFAGFEDHDACVRENQDKEDPDAFCNWLKDQAKDALSDPNADKVLTRLTTEFVSSVGNPAQASEWILFKDATTPRRKAAEVKRPYVFADPEDVASKAADVDVREENDDGERQIAYAAVLIPNKVDKQGDVIPPYVVERSAHEYMAEYRKMDSDHDLQDGAGTPVESWILKDTQEFELPDGGSVEYPEGTWVIGKRFTDDEWERVKSGELTGFSIYGGAQAIDVADLVDEAKNVDRRARKGIDATGSTSVESMLEALQDASKSDTPAATLADRVQAAKAELPDEDAAQVVEMLRASADVLDDSISGEGDGPEDDPESDEEDADEDDDVEESAKNEGENGQMSDENDTSDDGGTDTNGGDGADDGGVAEGIDELKSMVKGVDDKVDDFDDRLAEVEGEVETLKENVDVEDGAPGNDRLNEDDDDGARLKSVAKEAAREAVAEVAGVDPDEDDADDPEVVRKGLREQVGAEGGDDGGSGSEDYSGVFDDDGDTDTVSKSTGSHGNKRFAGGDA